MMHANLPTGVILAGGRSRRMGGGDKGLADLGGETMLARIVRRLRPQVGGLVLNANGDPARFAALGLPVVADAAEGFLGPLAGILAGMRWSLQHAPAATCIATVSSDVPFLPKDLVARLAAAVADRPGTIALARSPSGLHPVIGLWPVALAKDLEAQLSAGLHKVTLWTDRHGAVPVSFDPIPAGVSAVDPLLNVNTPEDLETARTLIARETM